MPAASTTIAARFSWYRQRLRAMDKREVLWRTGQVFRDHLRAEPDHGQGVDWQAALQGFRECTRRPVLLDATAAGALAAREPRLVEMLIDAAQRSGRREFEFFGYPRAVLEKPIDWHFDPISQVRWPDIPSRRLDHRVAAGDVKWIWELNRLQHLPWLAQAWIFTGDDRFSRVAFGHLDSWIEQNRQGVGIAWRGALEAGIRAISVAVALQGLRDSPELTVDRFRHVVTMLAHSAFRCSIDRSRFSSANAHLIGEMAGLAVVAVLFPELPLAPQWEHDAVATLSAEAERQILPDGCGAEQAIGYQLSTVELLHLVAVLLTIRDGRAPTAITDAIARSTRFLAAVVGQRDPDPRWGDNDEGFALRLGPEQVRTVRDHLGIVAALPWGSAAAELGSNTLTAEWYRTRTQSLAQPANEVGDPAAYEGSFHAPNGGLVVLRSGNQRVIMDVGRLGYLSIAAHGHSDALSVTLSHDGQDVIADPGAGSYYQRPEFRSVMRGTRAHSTVCIDDQDQSVSAGPFLWSHHARVTAWCVDLPNGVIDAEHDGYTRLAGRPIHRRLLMTPKEFAGYLVIDVVSGRGTHHVRTTWPLHPSVEPRSFDGGYSLLREGRPIVQLLQCATHPLRPDDVRGDSTRNLGWWSDRLEHRIPTWWLSGCCSGELPMAIATVITAPDAAVSDLAIRFAEGRIEVSVMVDDEPWIVAVDGGRAWI